MSEVQGVYYILIVEDIFLMLPIDFKIEKSVYSIFDTEMLFFNSQYNYQKNVMDIFSDLGMKIPGNAIENL